MQTLPHECLHPPVQEFWQPPTQLPVHVLAQPELQCWLQYPLQPRLSFSTALAITGLLSKATAPIIGSAFLAASLKNSLLFWVSLFLLFSIVCFAKVITHLGSSGIMFMIRLNYLAQKYTQFIPFQFVIRTNNLHFRQNNGRIGSFR